MLEYLIKLSKILLMTQNSSVQVLSPEQFQDVLQIIYNDMLDQQQKGDYVEADRLREKAIIQKRRWEEAYINYLEYKFNQDQSNLQKQYNGNIEQSNKEWTQTIQNYMKARNEQIAQTDKNNKKQIQELKKTMTEQWPSKVKESYQLLNLRQMQHHMSKQKDFYQANLMQQRINNVYNAELKAWHESRDKKIEQNVTNTKNRHNKERDLLNKKIQITVEDYNNKWRNDKISLQQRYNLQLKQMKAKYERQTGSFKGLFRTKGGIFKFKFEKDSQ